MRISLKFLALLWVGLLLIISVLLFNAYSKFKPEVFIALLTEQVQKNYPGAKLNVGNVAYRFSLDFNLKLEDIHLRRSGKLLGSIGEIELKVPWWLLLFNRGNAQINLTNLDMYIDHVEAHNPNLRPRTTDSNIVKVEVPSYLVDAKFTLRAKDVSVRDIHNARRYFTVSKLLVREFQYGKNSAFEINIPIEITHNETKYLSNLWLFGDVTPEVSLWKLNYHGEIRTRESNDKFQIEDLVIKGTSSFVPTSLSVRSEIGLFNDKDPIGNGKIEADQDSLTVNLAFTKLPLNYLEFVYEVIRNPYLTKLEGNAEGELKFHKKFNSNVAEMNGKVSFDGKLQLEDKNSLLGKWQVNFQNNRWEISFMSPKGEASFFRRSFLDLKKNKVTQYIEELGFSGIDLSSAIGPVRPLSTFINEVPDSYFRTSISFKNCTQNDVSFDGAFQYGYSPGEKFYQAELKSEASSFKLNFANKNTKKSLDVNFTQFNWHPAYTFLQPYYYATEGLLNGKVEGRWDNHWESGQWQLQLSTDRVSESRGKIPDFITTSASTVAIKDNKFQNGSLDLFVKNNIITLNSLVLESTETAKITGSLSAKQKSTLTVSYPKNKKLNTNKTEVIKPYWMEKDGNESEL